MSITNVDIAPITQNLTAIRDYTQKLEALSTFEKNFGDTRAVINAAAIDVRNAGTDVRNAIFSLQDSLKTCIEAATDKLDKVLGAVLKSAGTGASAAIASKTEQKPAERSLTAAMTPLPEVTKSAVMPEDGKPAEFESPEIVKALDTVAGLQKENNKLFDKFLKAEQKSKNAQNVQSLIKNPKIKPEEKKNKEVTERPKFPFNFKQFMGGLGTILKGILNPVALVMAFISKSLPYILLAVAFFMGVWEGIGEELREKATEIGLKILKYAGIVFMIFKGGPILIRMLALAYHAARMVILGITFARDTLLWSTKMGHETTLFATESGLSIFKRGLEIAKFVMEKIFIAFKFMLEMAKFILIAAAVVLVIGLFVLLVAGIFILFSLIGDKIIDGLMKVIEIFKVIGGFVVDIFMAVPNMIIDGVLKLFKGLGSIFGWFKGGKSESTAETTPAETKSEVTFSEELNAKFDSMVKMIVDPLIAIKKAVQFMVWNEMRKSMMGGEITIPVRAVPMMLGMMGPAVGMIGGMAATSAIMAPSDVISNTNISSTAGSQNEDIGKLQSDVSKMKSTIDDLYKLMESWHNEKPKTFYTAAMTSR